MDYDTFCWSITPTMVHNYGEFTSFASDHRTGGNLAPFHPSV